MGGSECHCRKCGLKIAFNRGRTERIDSKELEAFRAKYKGSIMDF